MLSEYIIQIYYLSLTFFFPSQQGMSRISLFYVICCIHMPGDKKTNRFIAKSREASTEYSLFTRYFPSYNAEAKLLKCYSYRIFQFLLFVPNLHHPGLLVLLGEQPGCRPTYELSSHAKESLGIAQSISNPRKSRRLYLAPTICVKHSQRRLCY